MNGARWLTQALEAEGVDTLFGYPGGTIMPFYDALVDSPALKHILVRHEQGAALAANGYARASGRVGVCVATSGPGASNLVTGIADAMLDSVPMVVLTGQVPPTLMGTDAFQELDVFGDDPADREAQLRRARGRPADDGARSLPHRAQRPPRAGADRPAQGRADGRCLAPAGACAAAGVDAVEQPRDAPGRGTGADRAGAAKPVVYGGGGIALGDAVQAFRTFVDATQIPTVLTLKGLGALPTQHPLNLGMLGMHGTRAANMAVQECDLLIVVGRRFDDRATGKLAEFAPNARVVHMDIDACEIGKLRAADMRRARRPAPPR
jgi:acetolactate synthase-1/2/3 large subunit